MPETLCDQRFYKLITLDGKFFLKCWDQHHRLVNKNIDNKPNDHIPDLKKLYNMPFPLRFILVNIFRFLSRLRKEPAGIEQFFLNIIVNRKITSRNVQGNEPLLRSELESLLQKISDLIVIDGKTVVDLVDDVVKSKDHTIFLDYLRE